MKLAKNCGCENLQIDKFLLEKELAINGIKYDSNINYKENNLKIISILNKCLKRQFSSNVIVTETHDIEDDPNIIYINIVYI